MTSPSSVSDSWEYTGLRVTASSLFGFPKNQETVTCGVNVAAATGLRGRGERENGGTGRESKRGYGVQL